MSCIENMNTNELQLKKKWDDEIQGVGVMKCFENVFYNDYENVESWLKIYFNNLEFEDKCQIIGYAGWNVTTKLKGIVEDHELFSLNLYSWILTHDINDLICKNSIKTDDIIQKMNQAELLSNSRIQWLLDEVDMLHAEIADLKSKIEELKNA